MQFQCLEELANLCSYFAMHFFHSYANCYQRKQFYKKPRQNSVSHGYTFTKLLKLCLFVIKSVTSVRNSARKLRASPWRIRKTTASVPRGQHYAAINENRCAPDSHS